MLIERTLRYLGWHGALDEPMRQLLDSCAQEVGHCAHHLRMRVFRCHMIRCGFLKLASSCLRHSWIAAFTCVMPAKLSGSLRSRSRAARALLCPHRYGADECWMPCSAPGWKNAAMSLSADHHGNADRALCPGYGDIPLALNERLALRFPCRGSGCMSRPAAPFPRRNR